MRKNTSRVLALLIILVVGAVTWRITHPPLSPSQRIELALQNATTSLENRSVGGVMSALSKDFAFNGTPRKEIADILRGAFFQWRDVKMQRTQTSIEVRGESASTRGSYILNFRPNIDATVETQRGEYALEWRLENDEWKVVRANVKPESGAALPAF